MQLAKRIERARLCSMFVFNVGGPTEVDGLDTIGVTDAHWKWGLRGLLVCTHPMGMRVEGAYGHGKTASTNAVLVLETNFPRRCVLWCHALGAVHPHTCLTLSHLDTCRSWPTTSP